MTFPPNVVANNVLRRAFDDRIDVNPLKLSRILYFTAAVYGNVTGEEMLHERFAGWDLGPVLPSVYEKFSCYGAEPIRAYAPDAAGQRKTIAEREAPILRSALDIVWEQTRGRTASELAVIAGAPGSAWYKARTVGAEWLDPNDIAGDSSLIADYLHNQSAGKARS